MRQKIISIYLILYILAATVAPVVNSFLVQYNTPPRFMLVCSCGCNGDKSKCSCGETNLPAYKSCSLKINDSVVGGIFIFPVILSQSINLKTEQKLNYSQTTEDCKLLAGFHQPVFHPPPF